MDKVIVSQLGARMHYAVPRLLASSGMLERFYTDICGTRGWPRLLGAVPRRLQPAAVRRLAGRIPWQVPDERITSFGGIGLAFALMRMAARTPTQSTAAHLWAGRKLARAVAAADFGRAAGVYAYSGECLELLTAARARGLWTAVEQIIAPREIVDRLVQEEAERFPDWQPPAVADRLAGTYAARERAEWAAANLVVCGSEFVRQGVIDQGGDPRRCVVVPYGVDARFSLPARASHGGPLRVLTVGSVGLRKGSPYVLEAARRLRGRAQFRLIGPCDLGPAPRAALAEGLEFIPGVPRAEILSHYAWADVFLLPSICEGSATAVYEAMTAGLPAIVTANTGSVVRDGTDGYVVPIRDVDAITQAVETLAAEPDLRRAMAENARRRAQDFDLQAYGRRLCRELRSVRSPALDPASDQASARNADTAARTRQENAA
ncbi:glycosyltransferase family 4 protein [Arenibaculum pallidiluteum]|uniref:glycosyltransferase family 4 protein n=1 Tax=Arenibaculum pallidiluteum TaxID=2812559 RepID=UPI001A958769|nr:glycosyltransferase family 4 protein [Arenibaculum pallidiluteum]